MPAGDVATLRLAGVVSPPSPDANSTPAVPITIPLTVTNTGRTPLYDLSVGSLRSAPITTRSQLTTAFGGAAVALHGLGGLQGFFIGAAQVEVQTGLLRS